MVTGLAETLARGGFGGEGGLSIVRFALCRAFLALLWQSVKSDTKFNGFSKGAFWRKPLIFQDSVERVPK
jgi:hypothetical protein